jgi:hypothetical protein
VTRGVLGHLLSRALVFSETNADDLGRLSRRAHFRAPAMRRTHRDGLLLLAVGGALAFWRIHLDPSYGVGEGPFDWRFHFVWLYPLVVTALTPLAFHPYILGGRDLPRSAPRPRALPHAAERAAPKTQTLEPAAPRRQGVA